MSRPPQLRRGVVVRDGLDQAEDPRASSVRHGSHSGAALPAHFDGTVVASDRNRCPAASHRR